MDMKAELVLEMPPSNRPPVGLVKSCDVDARHVAILSSVGSADL